MIIYLHLILVYLFVIGLPGLATVYGLRRNNTTYIVIILESYLFGTVLLSLIGLLFNYLGIPLDSKILVYFLGIYTLASFIVGRLRSSRVLELGIEEKIGVATKEKQFIVLALIFGFGFLSSIIYANLDRMNLGLIPWDFWRTLWAANVVQQQSRLIKVWYGYYPNAFSIFLGIIASISQIPISQYYVHFNVLGRNITLTFAILSTYVFLRRQSIDIKFALISSLLLVTFNTRGGHDFFYFLSDSFFFPLILSYLELFLQWLEKRRYNLLITVIAIFCITGLLNPILLVVEIILSITGYIIHTGKINMFLTLLIIGTFFLIAINTFHISFQIQGPLGWVIEPVSYSSRRWMVSVFTPVGVLLAIGSFILGLFEKRSSFRQKVVIACSSIFLVLSSMNIFFVGIGPERLMMFGAPFIYYSMVHVFQKTYFFAYQGKKISFRLPKIRKSWNVNVSFLLISLCGAMFLLSAFMSHFIYASWASSTISPEEADVFEWLRSRTNGVGIIVSDPASEIICSSVTLQKGPTKFAGLNQISARAHLKTFFNTQNITETKKYITSLQESFQERDVYIVISPRTRYWVTRMPSNTKRNQPMTEPFLREWDGFDKFNDEDIFTLIHENNNILIFKFVSN